MAEDFIQEQEVPDEGSMEMPGCPGWMVTFGDAISLLMTFFVLIYSFSEPDPSSSGKIEFFKKSGGTQDIAVFGAQGEGSAITAGTDIGKEGQTGEGEFDYIEQQVRTDMLEVTQSNQKAINYSATEIKNYFTGEGTEAKGKIEKKGPGGYRLLFDQNYIFALGRDQFRPESKKALDKIGKLISELPNDIIIVGFASDFNKIAFPLYPSNMHLATARAYAIARFFQNAWDVEPERIGIKVEYDKQGDNTRVISESEVEAKVIIDVMSEFEGYLRSEIRKNERFK